MSVVDRVRPLSAVLRSNQLYLHIGWGNDVFLDPVHVERDGYRVPTNARHAPRDPDLHLDPHLLAGCESDRLNLDEPAPTVGAWVDRDGNDFQVCVLSAA